ncbi:MAG: GNAT family N-acetyltransferase [Oscillospiraceae bacterium]|nr:GNAT family N-acetyltransferase [Oscillospiraceae bacterium]
METNIRMAAVDDIEKLINARFDYFETENWEAPSEQRPVIELNLRQYFTNHLNIDFFAAVIEENNQIASLAFLSISECPANPFYPTGKTGVIRNVLTYPEHRKRGLATKALCMLIEEAKRQSLSFLELSASESGRPLYKRLGFRKKEPSCYTEMRLSLL